MEKISSHFPSDVLRLLSLTSVIHRRSWKQQTKAAAEWHQEVWVFCPAIRGVARRQMEWPPKPEPSQWAM